MSGISRHCWIISENIILDYEFFLSVLLYKCFFIILTFVLAARFTHVLWSAISDKPRTSLSTRRQPQHWSQSINCVGPTGRICVCLPVSWAAANLAAEQNVPRKPHVVSPLSLFLQDLKICPRGIDIKTTTRRGKHTNSEKERYTGASALISVFSGLRYPVSL